MFGEKAIKLGWTGMHQNILEAPSSKIDKKQKE
jgi:hypothetical protein